jgi:hypothetical protein
MERHLHYANGEVVGFHSSVLVVRWEFETWGSQDGDVPVSTHVQDGSRWNRRRSSVDIVDLHPFF